MISIYALINPANNSVFYIGATLKPESRISGHISDSKRCLTDKDIYINDLMNKGYLPTFEVLDICEPFHAWFWEDFYIQLHRSWGFTLMQGLKYQEYPLELGFRYFMKNKKMDTNDHLRLLNRWLRLANINSLKDCKYHYQKTLL